MKKTLFVLFLFSSIFSQIVWAQTEMSEEVFVPSEDLLLSGYSQRISGTNFIYATAIPDVNETMIVRATDGNWSMEWETALVPENISSEYVSFVWGADLDSQEHDIPMELTINDTQSIAFQLNKKKQWRVENQDGMTLSFSENITDQNGDYFGFMILRVPAEKLEKGSPLLLKITGGNANSNAWYMTVKSSVEELLMVDSDPALLNVDGRDVQPLTVNMVRFGEPGDASFILGDSIEHNFEATFGLNQFVVYHPEVDQSETMQAKIDTGLNHLMKEVEVIPVRKWKMHIVQNTHTDIGYTRPQTEIMSSLVRHLDLALDYMDATDHLPEDSQFRWTAENTWAVDQFLQSRTDEQIERLKKRVDEGRLELTGMYLNFDELPDEQVLARSLEPVDRIRSHDLRMTTAMQNDVNGIGWAFNDYFKSLDISYLTMGTHGHKALIAFDHPTPFWWESPSGNRMLAYRSEHYHFGNFQFHISRGDFDYFEKSLLAYLNDLAEKGYPYNEIMIQHSGYLTDNSPPSIRSTEMIHKWNEKYEWPKLRFSIARDFFEEIEEKHANELPVYRAAWPDWWVDGFGSGAREMATARQAQLDITAAEGLLSMAALMGYSVEDHNYDQVDLTNESLLFYGEHTFGSHASVRDPHGKETLEMRRMKESFAYEALRRAKMIQENAFGLIGDRIPKLQKPSLLVANPYPKDRSGYTELFIDHETVPAGNNLSLVDAGGKEYQGQELRTIHGGTYWAFRPENIPPFGYEQYILTTSEKFENQPDETTSKTEYENDWYRLTIDPQKGAISSLFDKDLELELVDQNAKWGMGEFIYEELGNRVELDQYYLESYERSTLERVRFEGIEKGPLWDTIIFIGDTKAAIGNDGFEFEIRMHHHKKEIELVYLIQKKAITDPEGVYIAMPFQLENGSIYHDVPGGMIESGVDQIPGSSNDWNMVQSVVAIENEEQEIMVGIHEAPLMQLGAINTGRFEAGAEPESTHIFGWPMNNYWVTNFNGDQEGGFEWHYSITSTQVDERKNPELDASENRFPLISRVIPAETISNQSRIPAKQSWISSFPENILPVSIRLGQDSESILIHLREVEGKSTEFRPEISNSDSWKIIETDLNGNVLDKNPRSNIELEPYEVKFYKLTW